VWTSCWRRISATTVVERHDRCSAVTYTIQLMLINDFRAFSKLVDE
jgi:hypothetical protein